jgi:hypothetical protein
MKKFTEFLKEGVSNTWYVELQKVPQLPQRQDSLNDQMNDLYHIANKFGFYDAADYIKNNFEDK